MDIIKKDLINWAVKNKELPTIKKLYLLQTMGVVIKDTAYMESEDQLRSTYIFEVQLTIPGEKSLMKGGELDDSSK